MVLALIMKFVQSLLLSTSLILTKPSIYYRKKSTKHQHTIGLCAKCEISTIIGIC